MRNAAKFEVKPLVPGRKIRRAAWIAVVFGIASVVLTGIGIFGSSGSRFLGQSLLQLALVSGLLGEALSLGVLGTAIFRRSRCGGQVIGQVSAQIPIPFVLILPVCYFQAMGLGLGGEEAASNFYGSIGTVSFCLAPITFIVALVVGTRTK
jgi:hypothetical protein